MELAFIAQDTGGEVIRGPVRYAGEMGDPEVGGCQLKGQNVIHAMARLWPVDGLHVACDVCGTPYVRDERLTRSTEREAAQDLIERMSQADTPHKGSLIRDAEESFEGLEDDW